MNVRIDMHASLDEFFGDLLQEALNAAQLDLEESSRLYLLKLFTQFCTNEGLNGRSTEDPGTPALVRLYEQACSKEPGMRFDAFRYLGDVALFVSGCFTPHIERQGSLVGVNYYVDMGASAYLSAASLSRNSGFEELLQELAAHFRDLVHVFGHVAERTTLPVSSDVRVLYESFVRNPESLLLRDRFLHHGAIPVFAANGGEA